MMMKLVVKDVVGPYCGTYEDGAKLYRVLYGLLKDSQQVELDFEGIELTSSSFFNGAIVNLLQEFTGKDGQLPISFCNLTLRDKFILDRTLKAAKHMSEVIVEA